MYKVIKSRPFVVLLAIIMFIVNFGVVSAKDIREVVLIGGKGKPGEYVTVDVSMKKPEGVAGIQCTIGYDTTTLEIENKDIEVGKVLEGFMYEKNVIKEKSYLKFSAISKEGMNKKDDNVLFSLQFKIKEDAKEGKIPVTIDYLLVTDTMNQDIQSSTKNAEIHIKKEVVPRPGDNDNENDNSNKGNNESKKMGESYTITDNLIEKLLKNPNEVFYVEVKLPQQVKKVDVHIQRQALNMLIEKKVPGMKINVGIAEISFDPKLLALLQQTTSEDIVLEIEKLEGEEKGIILSLTDGKNKITTTEAVSISIRLPYEKMKNQLDDALVVRHIGDGGREGLLATSYFDSKTNTIVFMTRELNKFVVEYNPLQFDDVKNHKYENAIYYLAARGVISGMGDGTFAPDKGVTRAEFVKMLANMANVDTSRYMTPSFIDVDANKWYTSSIEWASQNNIVHGIGDKRFAPEAAITQEQMATMVVNLMKTMAYETTKESSYTPYKDEEQISVWAKEAVIALQHANILKEDRLNPQTNATRGEVAKVLTALLKQLNY